MVSYTSLLGHDPDDPEDIPLGSSTSGRECYGGRVSLIQPLRNISDTNYSAIPLFKSSQARDVVQSVEGLPS